MSGIYSRMIHFDTDSGLPPSRLACKCPVKVHRIMVMVMRKQRPPFEGHNDPCPGPLRALIEECWSQEPHERPEVAFVYKAFKETFSAKTPPPK